MPSLGVSLRTIRRVGGLWLSWTRERNTFLDLTASYLGHHDRKIRIRYYWENVAIFRVDTASTGG